MNVMLRRDKGPYRTAL